MTQIRKPYKLPAGTQTFSKIIEENYIYVDKTKFLVDMIDSGRVYFFSRPRRFGKSLTCSTFEAMFSGQKDLFKGLYAEEFMNRPDYYASPVIRLDMSRVTTYKDVEGMEYSIIHMLKSIAESFNIELSEYKQSNVVFDDLIKAIAEKHGNIVLLLDEYDKPYTDFFTKPEIAEQVRELLRNFYVKIKVNDACFRFVFITGISKFTKIGVFSGLNSPIDISLNENYSEMCGYTQEELETYFSDHLDQTMQKFQITKDELLAKIKNYYDGFCFDGIHKLYNPFSTLSFFIEKTFANYWMTSGTTKVIADYLKNKKLTVEEFREKRITLSFAHDPGEMDSTLPEGFFYQSGYLSVKRIEGDDFILDYPNTEVLTSMSRLLAANIVGNGAMVSFISDITAYMNNGSVDAVIDIFNELLAAIPYDDFSKAARQKVLLENLKFPAQEWLYRSTLLAFVRGTGLRVQGEVHNNRGRADIVMTTYNNLTWIIEIKVAYTSEDVPAKLEEGKKQFRENDYSAPYANPTSIVLVIDDTKRQIVSKDVW